MAAEDLLGIVVVTSKEKAIRDLAEIVAQAAFKTQKSRLVLVKPNVCGMYPPSIGLLESVIKYLKPSSQAIVIGETPSGMHTPSERFASLGIDKIAKRHEVTTLDLMNDKIVNKIIPKPHAMEVIRFPSTVFQADLLVNCPGLGTHGNTLLTCALKNLFGLVAERHKYTSLHMRGVSEVIADIYQVVKPQLNVVDSGEKVLVGTDALSIDLLASEIKGLSPNKVKHLALAAEDRSLDIRSLEVKSVEV